jgi:hypothetical protein
MKRMILLRVGKHLRAVLTSLLRGFSILLLMTEVVLGMPLTDSVTGTQFDFFDNGPLRDGVTGAQIELPDKWSAVHWSGNADGWFGLYRMPREARVEMAKPSDNQADCWIRTVLSPKQTIEGMDIRDPGFPEAFKLRYKEQFDLLSANRFVSGQIVSVILVLEAKPLTSHRQLIAHLSSPKSQVNVLCYVTRDRLHVLQPEFEEIYRSVRFPE